MKHFQVSSKLDQPLYFILSMYNKDIRVGFQRQSMSKLMESPVRVQEVCMHDGSKLYWASTLIKYNWHFSSSDCWMKPQHKIVMVHCHYSKNYYLRSPAPAHTLLPYGLSVVSPLTTGTVNCTVRISSHKRQSSPSRAITRTHWEADMWGWLTRMQDVRISGITCVCFCVHWWKVYLHFFCVLTLYNSIALQPER